LRKGVKHFGDRVSTQGEQRPLSVTEIVNLVVPGLNDRTMNRYIRRGGHLIDMQTGRVVD
jgi:hypothetical protein